MSRPLSEADWRARDDADTLARAEEIKQDESRLNAAKGAAQKMLEDKKDDLKALAKVAGKPIKENTQGDKKIQSRHNVFQNISKK